MTPDDVLHFWFRELKPKAWWEKDENLDRMIAERFGATHEAAARCELDDWRESAAGRLAEIIVLDQFSRNIHRGRPEAFACDPLALALAQEALRRGCDKEVRLEKRPFFYMPFMHSESQTIQTTSVELFRQLGVEQNLQFAIRHKEIVDRFGRYPHRNAILGRPSSMEEEAFLKTPGSSF